MTREEAKDFLPIITAFAEGKTIEVMNTSGHWDEINIPILMLIRKNTVLNQNLNIVRSKMQKSVGRKCRSISRLGG